MSNYYSSKLNSSDLKKCYEIAPPRVKQFLKAEIDFVLNNISSNSHILDLGCGYGRVAKQIFMKAGKLTGIDISKDNIELAKEYVGYNQKCEFFVMDAENMEFPDNNFDVVICVQNGISAFKVDPLKLVMESIRVTKDGGIILYSSYSKKIWEQRLNWFKIQSRHKLIGEIDEDLTKSGVIVCKDGFQSLAYSPKDFLALTKKNNICSEIIEIDDSIIFCKIKVKKNFR